MSTSILDHVLPLQDPRIERNKLHALADIMLLTVCAVVSGADGWEAIEEFGREKRDWLRPFAPFKNGVPSHDGIANVLARLSPKGFQECFGAWTRAVATATAGEVIAVDGKSARGARDRSTWSVPGRAPTASFWGRRRRRRSPTRSRPSRSCWSCLNSRGAS